MKHLFQKKVNHTFIVPKTVITKNNMKRTEGSAGKMYPG